MIIRNSSLVFGKLGLVLKNQQQIVSVNMNMVKEIELKNHTIPPGFLASCVIEDFGGTW